MRRLWCAVLLLIVSACAPAGREAQVRAVEQALVADAGARAAQSPEHACDIVTDAWRVALEARHDEAARQLDGDRRRLGCRGEASGGIAHRLFGALDAAALAGARADWLVMRVEALISAPERRAVDAYDALEPRCRAVADGAGAFPEITAVFLEDPARRRLSAIASGSARYTVCAHAYDTAARRHAAAGEDGWAYWWWARAAELPAGAGAAVLVRARDESATTGQGGVAAYFAEAAAAGLVDRARFADLDAAAQFAGRPDLVAAAPDYLGSDIALALAAAIAAGHPVRLAPAADVARWDSLLWRFDDALEAWISEGLLDDAPRPAGAPRPGLQGRAAP